MKISILGATGCVGSAAAFHIGMLGLTNELTLIGGKRHNVLEHHVIDLSTATAELDILIRAGKYEDLANSDIIINAAGAHQPLSRDRRDISRSIKITHFSAMYIDFMILVSPLPPKNRIITLFDTGFSNHISHFIAVILQQI